MARLGRDHDDAAVDAARLLRRLGFAVLAMAAPALAIGTRRGLVIVVPIGMALLLLASLLETEGRAPFSRTWEGLRGPAGLLAGFIFFWAALSLLWTPFPAEAAERLVNALGFGLFGLLTAAALPERMRSSDLYLLPVGVGLAGIGALALTIWPMMSPSVAEFDRSLLDRGLLLLVLMAPMAVTWLVSRDRFVSAFLLVAVVTASLVLGNAQAALAAMILGALVFAVATVNPPLGRMLSLAAMPGLVIAAPLIPFLLRPGAKLVLGSDHARVNSVRTWARIVTDDPLRLITGHGLDTAMRAKAAGLVPAQTPSGILFEVWYDLGFLGAGALALLLSRAILGASRLHAGAAPGALMTLMVAFTLAVAGQGSIQAWWLIGLSVACVMVFAVDHGQYRTRRPPSRIVAPRRRRIPAP
ncbi:peptide ABC transporter permease [Alsobacter sp. SYSU M60028]|uniref:Peptide ABC transporter permease n=1 Tax=Alsobacter ponti TaxID=2962936 RepID=A0ABT1LCQ4_9HYPH|nr:peptide ABC transporter permease [Alsobacter ponti]MCP8938848.1 peptide ABC transporter permease [Alsobacter ponti]